MLERNFSIGFKGVYSRAFGRTRTRQNNHDNYEARTVIADVNGSYVGHGTRVLAPVAQHACARPILLGWPPTSPSTLFHASLPPEFMAQLPPTRAIKCHQLSLTEFRIYLPARRRLLDLSCRDCDKPNHDFATSSCNSANFKSSLFFFFFFWTKSFSREYSLFLFIVIGKLMSKNNFTILSPREISIRNAAKLELKTEKLDITLLKKYSTFRKIIENGRLTKVAQKFSLTQRFDKLRPAPCYARNTLIRSQTNVHRCNCPGTHDLILRIK